MSFREVNLGIEVRGGGLRICYSRPRGYKTVYWGVSYDCDTSRIVTVNSLVSRSGYDDRSYPADFDAVG